MIKNIKYIGLILLGLFLLTCSPKKDSGKDVVARVDQRIFSEDEIAWAYELAPSQFTKLDKQKALDILVKKMINQKLLADKARQQGLDDNPEIQRIINYYRDAEVIRQLYLKHIRDSVNISEKELRKAFQRDKQGLLVKHYATKKRDEAESLWRSNAIPRHIPLLSGTRLMRTNKFGEVDSIEWNVLDVEIEDIVYELPLDSVSRPISHDGFYHIFKVVDKDMNVFTRKSEFSNRKASLKGAVRKRKEHEKAFQFVKRIMQPQELIIKSDVLDELAGIIYDRYQNSDRKSVKIKNKEMDIEKIMHKPLYESRVAEFKSGNMTVSDFFFYNKVNPQPINIKNKATVRHNLVDIIATYVRDQVFAEKGHAEGLEELAEVKKEKVRWSEKILANELKRSIYKNIEKSNNKSDLSRQYSKKLKEMLTGLRQGADISINRDRLYNIKTSDQGLSRKIDFFAKHL